MEKRLKPFAYSDSCKKPVKDDTRVDEFLESGKEQEDEINESIEEGVERGTNLSEEANEILSEVESQVEEQAKEFASSVIEAISPKRRLRVLPKSWLKMLLRMTRRKRL